MLGPPGSFRKDYSLYIAEQFGWACIDLGELLKKEVIKKSEIGKKVQDAFKSYRFSK